MVGSPAITCDLSKLRALRALAAAIGGRNSEVVLLAAVEAARLAGGRSAVAGRGVSIRPHCSRQV